MADRNEALWSEIEAREGRIYVTHKGKQFSYHMKRSKHGEPLGAVSINNSATEITRSTVLLAFHEAEELQSRKGCVSSPGKLGTHGSQYLYPVFLDIGVCTRSREEEVSFDPERTAETAIPAGQPEESVPAEKKCVHCGYTTSEDFDFCPKCGHPF